MRWKLSQKLSQKLRRGSEKKKRKNGQPRTSQPLLGGSYAELMGNQFSKSLGSRSPMAPHLFSARVGDRAQSFPGLLKRSPFCPFETCCFFHQNQGKPPFASCNVQVYHVRIPAFLSRTQRDPKTCRCSAGNEKWNDPPRNRPTCGFLYAGILKSGLGG